MMKITDVGLFSDTLGGFFLIWQRLRRDILIEEGVTPADKRILYGLHNNPGISKSVLAVRIVLENSSLTRSLDRLHAQGLIERTVNPEDQRAVVLSLSAKGLQKVKNIRKKSSKQLQAFMPEMDGEQFKQCLAYFEEIIEGMHAALGKSDVVATKVS